MLYLCIALFHIKIENVPNQENMIRTNLYENLELYKLKMHACSIDFHSQEAQEKNYQNFRVSSFNYFQGDPG